MLEFSETPISDQIEMLRVQLETALALPIVLLVSSALHDDGHCFVATELARSMHEAGYSTLLVRTEEKAQEHEKALEPTNLDRIVEFGIEKYLVRAPRTASPTLVVSSSSQRHAVSRTGVVRFLDTCRKSYDVTIIAAPDPLRNSLAILTAVASDGVLLTVREGRRVHNEDRGLAKVLSRERAPFLGVVSISGSIIDRALPFIEVKRRPAQVGKIRTTIGSLDVNHEEQAV